MHGYEVIVDGLSISLWRCHRSSQGTFGAHGGFTILQRSHGAKNEEDLKLE